MRALPTFAGVGKRSHETICHLFKNVSVEAEVEVKHALSQIMRSGEENSEFDSACDITIHLEFDC